MKSTKTTYLPPNTPFRAGAPFTKGVFSQISGLFIALVLVFFQAGCASTKGLKNNITLEEFQTYHWQQKTEFFENLSSSNKSEKIPKPIYDDAFQDIHTPVIIAAIKSLSLKLSDRYRQDLYKLLNHPHAIVRWESCKQIGALPLDKDLRYLMKLISDNEWLVRECVFRSVRLYQREKIEKKYFYYILRGLKDKNPNVLIQIYRTLYWYRDERAFPYMLARSYHAANAYELVVIIRELAKYNNRKVRHRLRELSRRHPDFMVREEATKLLLKMYN